MTRPPFVGKVRELRLWLWPGVDKSKIELLATCEFARRKETVLLLGPAGVGKTHLAAGLGSRLLASGYPVWFVLADQLIEMMRRDEAQQRRMGLRKYMTCRVLIIDELGFQALERADANRLFRLINHRYHVVQIDGHSYRLRHLDQRLMAAGKEGV